MTVSVNTTPGFASRLVNGGLAIKPLADLVKHQARQMMIKRAERIGVPWTQEAETEYFALDIEQVIVETGFQTPTITNNTHRHCTAIAQVSG